MRRVAGVGLLALALVTGAGAPLHAAGKAPAEQAQAHFDLGRRLYAVGEYRKALDEFKAAYVAKADPALLFNIAECHRQLGDRAEASTFYRRFLARGESGQLRSIAEQHLDELATASPIPTASPPPALVFSAPLPRAASSPTADATPKRSGPSAPALLITNGDQTEATKARPVYRRWWFWAIGAGVIAGAVAALVLVGRDETRSDCLGITPCGTLP